MTRIIMKVARDTWPAEEDNFTMESGTLPQGGMGSYPSVSIRWTEEQGHLYKSPEFAKSLIRLEDGEQAARCG